MDVLNTVFGQTLKVNNYCLQLFKFGSDNSNANDLITTGLLLPTQVRIEVEVLFKSRADIGAWNVETSRCPSRVPSFFQTWYFKCAGFLFYNPIHFYVASSSVRKTQ